MELDDLAETIDRLVGSDPSSYADTEPVEALQRQLTRLHGFVTATAAFDVSGAWAPDGARNAAAWLATRCRLPKAQARSQVRRGRALRHLPVCAQAWLDGDIGAAHVDVLTAVRRDATEEALGRDEEMLVGQARRLRHESFVRAVAHWGQLADPRRHRGGRRGTALTAPGLPRGELPGDVARQDHPRSDLGDHRRH
jgi:hypothetical protein